MVGFEDLFLGLWISGLGLLCVFIVWIENSWKRKILLYLLYVGMWLLMLFMISDICDKVEVMCFN